MGAIFGYVTASQLASSDDPLEILRSAETAASLLALTSFGPDSADHWAAAKVQAIGPRVQILNEDTNQSVSATVCRLSA